MGSLKEHLGAFLLLIVLIGVNEFALYNWAQLESRPPAWDEAIHTRLAVEYRERLQTEGLRGVLHPAYFNYPPLYHLALSSVLDVPRDFADAGAIVNGVVLAALMLVVFFLGRSLLGPWEGLGAAFLLCAYPSVVDLTRPPMIDLMLTLWVTLGVAALIWSESFTSVFWTVVFGVVSGLGMLTKWSYAIYVAVPFLVVFVRSVRGGTWGKALLGAAIGTAVAFPWYIENFLLMASHLSQVAGGRPASGLEFTGLRNVLWYAFDMGEALNLYFLLLLIPGLVVAFWRPKLAWMLVWFLSGLALFTLIRNHNVRYAVPVLPAAAILSVAWLPPMRKWVLGIVMAGTAGFFLFQQLLPEHRTVTTVASVPVVLWNNQAPRSENWNHDAILKRIEDLAPKNQYTRVVILSNHPQFHSTTLNLSAEMRKTTTFGFSSPSRDRWLDFKRFILAKTKNLGPEGSIDTIQKASDLVFNPPAWFKNSYREVGRWNLPDGSEAVLFQAHPEPLKGFQAGALQMTLGNLTIGRIEIENVDIRVDPLSPADTAVGRFKELRVKAARIRSKDLTFENADLRLMKPQINLPRFLETGEIQLISAESLEPHLTLNGDLVTSYAARKVKGLTDPRINFDGSAARLDARFHGVPVSIAFLYQVDPNRLLVRLQQARAGFLPLPNILFSGLTDRVISLTPDDEMPFRLDLKQLSGSGSTLKVGT